MASEAFQLDIMELLQKHYPGAIRGNIEDNAGAAHDLSIALGAMLAFAYRLNGEVVGRTVLETVIKNIVENAAAVDASAETMIREHAVKMLAPAQGSA